MRRVYLKMDGMLDYSKIFQSSLNTIRSTSNISSLDVAKLRLNWDIVEQNAFFDFTNDGFSIHNTRLQKAKDISKSFLDEIVLSLLEQNGYEYELIDKKELRANNTDFKLFNTLNLCLYIKSRKELLFFKDIEECPFFADNTTQPEPIRELMYSFGAENYLYIYYMHDYAYLQVINYNKDMLNPGKEYNVVSFDWFFTQYFGKEEYDRFIPTFHDYISQVQDYLSYIHVKSLTPNALVNYQRIIRDRLQSFKYNLLLNKIIRKERNGRYEEYLLDQNDYHSIYHQFMDQSYFYVLLGKHSFAESLITAEWLYDSMKKANAIDLTIVGMGYFKAAEQLLWEMICLHKDEGRSIKSSKLDSNNKIVLSSSTPDKCFDSSLGAMAVFYSDNLDILRDDLLPKTKWFVREYIFDYSKMRNEFFHKENIHSWKIIDDIRNLSYSILFLLLGSQKIDKNSIVELGFENLPKHSEYQKTCEYMNYHSDDCFILVKNNKERIYFASPDLYSTTSDEGQIIYSGIYVRPINDKRKYRIEESGMPDEILLAKLDIVVNPDFSFDIKPVSKIYSFGKYVGPSITEEEGQWI